MAFIIFLPPAFFVTISIEENNSIFNKILMIIIKLFIFRVKYYMIYNKFIQTIGGLLLCDFIYFYVYLIKDNKGL